jgi:hypothetical protein
MKDIFGGKKSQREDIRKKYSGNKYYKFGTYKLK